MWPFHQTKKIPPIAATNDANANAAIRCEERDVVSERRHAHRVVAHPLQRQPERRPRQVAQQQVDGERDDERRVVEPVLVRVDGADAATAPGCR